MIAKFWRWCLIGWASKQNVHRLGFQAFLHPTSFESRLRWKYKRFKARHPLPRNYQCLISGD
ncbi:MAG: hypothetical protein CMM00_14230 [Rhodopirellula sp.]|nr:hypothetical protein [Rhodopirellula sp.]